MELLNAALKGMPAGIGETVFDKLDASLAKAAFPLALSKVWKSVTDLKLQKATAAATMMHLHVRMVPL